MNKNLTHHLDSLWLQLNRISVNADHLMAHVNSARRQFSAIKAEIERNENDAPTET